MVDQNRLTRMTRLAAMEADDRDKELKIGSYKRGDYRILQLIWALVAGTACYLAMALFWIGWRWDDLDRILVQNGYRGLAIRFLACYLLFLAAYLILSVIIGNRRYGRARQKSEAYLDELFALQACYDRPADDRRQETEAFAEAMKPEEEQG